MHAFAAVQEAADQARLCVRSQQCGHCTASTCDSNLIDVVSASRCSHTIIQSSCVTGLAQVPGAGLLDGERLPTMYDWLVVMAAAYSGYLRHPG